MSPFHHIQLDRYVIESDTITEPATMLIHFTIKKSTELRSRSGCTVREEAEESVCQVENSEPPLRL